jgi:hypothetical protein
VSATDKKGVDVVFSTRMHGDGKKVRAVLDHKDGRFSIAVANHDGTAAEIEHTFTMAELDEWATKAFAGDPAARQKKGLGPILAGATLLMMVGIGMIKIEKAAA